MRRQNRSRYLELVEKIYHNAIERAQAEFSRSCCLAAEACQRAIDGAVRDREDNLRLLFPPPDPKESKD